MWNPKQTFPSYSHLEQDLIWSGNNFFFFFSFFPPFFSLLSSFCFFLFIKKWFYFCFSRNQPLFFSCAGWVVGCCAQAELKVPWGHLRLWRPPWLAYAIPPVSVGGNWPRAHCFYSAWGNGAVNPLGALRSPSSRGEITIRCYAQIEENIGRSLVCTWGRWDG